MIIVLFFQATLTFSRNSDWKDLITLFRKDAANFDSSCNIHYLMANKLHDEALAAQSLTEKENLKKEAVMHYQSALGIMLEGVRKYPKDYTTLNNIGAIYTDVFNNPQEAQGFFKKSLSINPADFLTQFNYAYCFEKIKKTDSAIFFYEKTISNNTDYLPAYIQLRNIYLAEGKYSQLLICDQKAIHLKKSAELFVNLGNSYLLNKDTANAITQFTNAIQIEPSNTNLRNQIVNFLKSIKKEEYVKNIELK